MKIRQFLLFLPVVTLLSCTKSLDIDDRALDLPPSGVNQLSVAMAQHYFSQYDTLFRSHSTRSDGGRDSLLSPSSFSADWNSTMRSVDRDWSSVQAAITGSRSFVAKWGDGVAPVTQQLLVLQADTACRAYIATIVPTVAHYQAHPMLNYVHFNRKVDFSGIVLFHSLFGEFVQVVCFAGGRIVRSYFTANVTDENYAAVKRGADSVMGDIAIYEQSVSTRLIPNGGGMWWGGDIGPVVCIGPSRCPIGSYNYLNLGSLDSPRIDSENHQEVFKDIQKDDSGRGGENGSGGDSNITFDAPLSSTELTSLLSVLGTKTTVDLTSLFQNGVTSITNNYVKGIIGGVEVSIRSISISGPYPQKGTCVLFTEPDGWAYPEFPEGHGITMKYYSPNRNCQMTITMLSSEYDKLPDSVK